MHPLPASLLALVASLCLGRAAHAAPAPLAGRGGPRVEVDRGRAVLITRGERGVELTPGSLSQAPDGGFLAVPAGSRVHLAWESRGSLRIEGPSELEWNATGDTLAWRLLAPGHVEIEVRRGPIELALPDGWSARLGAGAYRIEGLAGATTVGVRAGESLALMPLVPPGRARPPVVLAPGAQARLGPHLVPLAKGDALAAAEPWTAASWPWRGRGDASAWTFLEPPRAHSRDGSAPEHSPDGDESAPSGAPTTQLEPGADPAPEGAVEDPPTGQSASLPGPSAGSGPVPIPAFEPPRPGPRTRDARETFPYRSEHWRGFPREALERFAFGLLERAPGLSWRPLGDGLWQLSLAADAPLPAWLLGDRRDLALGPGSSVTLDESGHLRGYQGTVRILAVHPERPALELLEP